MKGIPEHVKTILSRLEAAGHEAYCVGGAVRDRLLGRAPGDWDVTTSALPEEVSALFAPHALPTGLRHGTVTVKPEGVPGVEVTTYRRDGAYSDCRRRTWPGGTSPSTPWPWTCGGRSPTPSAAGRT